MNTQNFPIIAGKGDTLGIIWQGSISSSPKLFFTSSVTGANGLGIEIDTITATFSGFQTRPDLLFSNGKFHVVYSDNNGNDVKYLTGTVNQSAGINEKEETTLSIFTSQQNGASSIHIQSQIQQHVSIQVVNSFGQILYDNDMIVQKGKSSIELSDTSLIGMCFIIITTDTGESIVQKCVINN